MKTIANKDRVVIFDTTLRDGEQSPGATMTHEEKLEIAEKKAEEEAKAAAMQKSGATTASSLRMRSGRIMVQ